MSNEKRSTEPHDDLTKLANLGLSAIDAEPGTDDLRCIVMVIRDGHGGIAAGGYGDGLTGCDSLMVADLLVHARAILRASGKDLQVVPL